MKLLPIIFSVAILTGCNFKSSEEYHREANKLEQEEKFKEAILLLDKAIEKDPNNIKALLDRAFDKSTIEDFKGAIDDYTKVIELDPDNGLAYLNRGKNKNRLEDYKGAIADFDKAISTKGGELIYMDKVENSFVETGFEYDVKMEEIKFERGIAYYKIDSLKGAFDDFNFSIQKNYLLPDSYYWRGLIYLSYNMKDEGCKDLNKAMELGAPDANDLLNKNCK
ncbi:MAG: hypothetical protein MH137_03805 [Flavobacteriales bacterium]|nr:hypothetical protein [Flavobacteriales bacterium]